MDFPIPAPPVTTSEPLEMVVESEVDPEVIRPVEVNVLEDDTVPVKVVLPTTVRLPPIEALFPRPIPPAVTSAPVVMLELSVVRFIVMVLLKTTVPKKVAEPDTLAVPRTLRPPPRYKFLPKPIPPETIKAPDNTPVLSVVLVTDVTPATDNVFPMATVPVCVEAPAMLIAPPILTFLDIPIPPEHTMDPVDVEVLSIVFVNVDAPVKETVELNVTAPPSVDVLVTVNPPPI